jgi:uncharacterized RDD family membrane protein YckC
MDIWIIRDGEKVGPIHDFDVRKMIEAREISSSTPAWHEGMSAWKPLVEIELFSREFELSMSPAVVEKTALREESPKPPPLPPQTFYVRRFWARWMDLYLYSGLWWLGIWAVGQDIEATIRNPWILFVRYVPWFVIEILMLHHFGTTPGKWLLGIRVTNPDGSLMNLSESMHRALRVMFAGIGFGWELLSVFCQALSVFTAKNLGNTLWDHAGGHQVVVTPLKPLRVVTLIAVFVFAFTLQILVVSRYTHKMITEVPEMKKLMPENPLWQLPERTRKP